MTVNETREHWRRRLGEMTVNDVRELTVLRRLAVAADRYFAASDIVDPLSQVAQMDRRHLGDALQRWHVAANIVDPSPEGSADK